MRVIDGSTPSVGRSFADEFPFVLQMRSIDGSSPLKLLKNFEVLDTEHYLRRLSEYIAHHAYYAPSQTDLHL